jgi:hypothetical protein
MEELSKDLVQLYPALGDPNWGWVENVVQSLDSCPSCFRIFRGQTKKQAESIVKEKA